MLGLGLGEGLSRSVRGIDERRRREQMDQDMAEDRALRREALGLQLAEQKNRQETREGLRQIAKNATTTTETAAPYVDEHSADPEFGLAAAGVQPAADGGYGLQSVTKTQKLDRAQYEDEVERFLAEREGPEAAMNYRNQRSALMKQGFGDFARALAMGDIQGAEQVAATAGKPVKPGTLRVDKERDVVSGVSADGKPFEMSFSAMLGVAGIRGKEQGKPMTVNPGQGIWNPNTGAWDVKPNPDQYGRSGAGGGRDPADMVMAQMYQRDRGGKVSDWLDHVRSGRVSIEQMAMDYANRRLKEQADDNFIDPGDPGYITRDQAVQEGYEMAKRLRDMRMRDQGAGGLQPPPPAGNEAKKEGSSKYVWDGKSKVPPEHHQQFIDQANAAIRAGKDAEAVKARLNEMGIQIR